MRREITDESGQIMLDGELLPGNFKGLDVEGSLDVTEDEIPGSSQVSRQIQGYKPAVVVVKVTLPTDEENTCFEKLRIWTARFKVTDSAARPYIRRLVVEHTAAWGIDEVLFKSIRSADGNSSDSLELEVRFEEWLPVVVRKEAARSGSVQLDPELQRLLGYGSPAAGDQNQPARRALLGDVEPTPE